MAAPPSAIAWTDHGDGNLPSEFGSGAPCASFVSEGTGSTTPSYLIATGFTGLPSAPVRGWGGAAKKNA